MNEITTIGIDLAKNIFQLHLADKHGKKIASKRLSRDKLLPFLANMPKCLIGMEACCGTNYWARQLIKLGHEVKIMAPQFVKPYVKSNKNDRNDAEAIVEAVTRPSMRFVSMKTTAQQDIQSLHRMRESALKYRIMMSNQIRGILLEYGITFPQSDHALHNDLLTCLEENPTGELSPLLKELIIDLYEQFKTIEKKISDYDKKIHRLIEQDEQSQRLLKIRGIGPMTASAMTTIGDVSVFKNGREMAAWLGLVPRHSASANKTRLMGISRRGDNYLRRLLIQGGRSLIIASRNKHDSLSRWINEKNERSGFNKTAVAIANKNARIIWAMLSTQQAYRTAV